MTPKKKMLVTVTSILAALLLFFGSFLAFDATAVFRAEKQYEALRDSKSLVKLCIYLTDSKDYERQIKYIKELTEKIDFAEFSKSMAQDSVWKKFDSKIIYQVMLTRYLEAYLHLNNPEQYLLEFPAIYKKYLDEKECFAYIGYSLSDKLLSDKQLTTVLTALNAHMEGEKKEIQLFNLGVQAAIYSSQDNKVQYNKINQKMMAVRKELFEESRNV